MSIGFLITSTAWSQYVVKGTVYDSSHRYTIPSVSVMTTSGRGTQTDSAGNYRIQMSEKDSLWFSFLGKPTPKYPFAKIADITQFDIALTLKSDVMKEIKIFNRSYKEDSLLNRKAYAKAFDFGRPTLKTSVGEPGTAVGIDLDEIIRMFQFRKNRSMLKFQERLVQQEQDKFVDHKFSKALVQRLTGLEGEKLERFMQIYRPSYQFALTTSEYDFQLYIKKAGEVFKQGRTF